MNILKLAFQIFLIYILYKLVVDFIIPVYRASKRLKKQFNDVQSQMNQQQQQYQQTTNTTQSPPPQYQEPKPKEGDYIEYEEIK